MSALMMGHALSVLQILTVSQSMGTAMFAVTRDSVRSVSVSLILNVSKAMVLGMSALMMHARRKLLARAQSALLMTIASG